MFSTAPCTAFLLLAVGVAANTTVVQVSKSPVSLTIARQSNLNGTGSLPKMDLARAKNLISIANAKGNGPSIPDGVASVNVTNAAVMYLASVGVGSPPTQYSLIVDTGSSNTWVGAVKRYVKTNTSVKTGQRVNVKYGSGDFYGNEYLDTVTLSRDLVIFQQSIGVAKNSSDIKPADGILGLGPSVLTVGTLSPDTNSTIATVTDNLYSQGEIGFNIVAMSFEPTTTTLEKNGEMTFGGYDSTKFTGSIATIPRTTADSNAKYYWGIDQSIKYGDHTILSTASGIVDTGTTLILIATDAFKRYKSVTGASMDNTTGLLEITNTQYSNLQSLLFIAGNYTFELVANAQIWPRSLNTYIGGKHGHIYLIVAELAIPKGDLSDLQFINGMSFLERFYSIFDSTTGTVGLAPTNYTMATTN